MSQSCTLSKTSEVDIESIYNFVEELENIEKTFNHFIETTKSNQLNQIKLHFESIRSNISPNVLNSTLDKLLKDGITISFNSLNELKSEKKISELSQNNSLPLKLNNEVYELATDLKLQLKISWKRMDNLKNKELVEIKKFFKNIHFKISSNILNKTMEEIFKHGGKVTENEKDGFISLFLPKASILSSK